MAVLQAWFMVLEMVLWRKPLERRTFNLTPERAEATATLAANQGLYNGFLAAGLVAPQPTAFHFKLFFLVCVIVAGLFGAATVSRRDPDPGPACDTGADRRAPRRRLRGSTGRWGRTLARSVI